MYICACSFFVQTGWEAFSALSVWQTANNFGKKCVNLSLKFGVLIVGEIEGQFFHQTLGASNFLFCKKVW